ncbi:hypothetical protein D3C76_1160590 [compost metagenome]
MIALQYLSEIFNDGIINQLPCGKIHCHPQIQALSLPLCGLSGGGLQHPAPEWAYQTGFFGIRDKLQRWDQAALG